MTENFFCFKDGYKSTNIQYLQKAKKKTNFFESCWEELFSPHLMDTDKKIGPTFILK